MALAEIQADMYVVCKSQISRRIEPKSQTGELRKDSFDCYGQSKCRINPSDVASWKTLMAA